MERNRFTPTPIMEPRRPGTKLVWGFTLFEVIISTLILAIATLGLANVFVSAKTWIWHSRSRTLGGELGRYFLDPLQMQVRQDQWGANCLSQNGTSDCGMGTQTVDGVTYTPSYAMTAHPSSANIRKVVLSLSWAE